PGGHLGRFCIWTQGAFEKLDAIYGTWRKASTEKSSYSLPKPIMKNSDLARLINSEEIQQVVRPVKLRAKRAQLKKNPLKNLGVMLKLNPHAKSTKRAAILAQERIKANRAKVVDKKRKTTVKK
ncbi:hypothetical protein, partial [Salmonella sp. s51933]